MDQLQHEYHVKRIKENIYEIYKFEEGCSQPTTTYTLTTYNSKFKCNCMSGRYRHYCKHHDMVKKYRQLERTWTDNPAAALAMITFKK